MDRLLEQLSTFNLAVGVEHESAERGRDDDKDREGAKADAAAAKRDALTGIGHCISS